MDLTNDLHYLAGLVLAYMHMICSIYIASLFILNHVIRLILFFIFTICINLEKCIRTLKVSWSLKYILFGLHVQWTFHSSNRVGQQTHLTIASWQFVIVIFHPKSLITNKEVVKSLSVYIQTTQYFMLFRNEPFFAIVTW